MAAADTEAALVDAGFRSPAGIERDADTLTLVAGAGVN